jgi:hypothetical protein
MTHICREGERLPTEALLDLRRECLADRELATRDDHIGAALGEREHHLPAEAAAAARDQNDLAREIGQDIDPNAIFLSRSWLRAALILVAIPIAVAIKATAVAIHLGNLRGIGTAGRQVRTRGHNHHECESEASLRQSEASQRLAQDAVRTPVILDEVQNAPELFAFRLLANSNPLARDETIVSLETTATGLTASAASSCLKVSALLGSASGWAGSARGRCLRSGTGTQRLMYANDGMKTWLRYEDWDSYWSPLAAGHRCTRPVITISTRSLASLTGSASPAHWR